MNEGLLRNPKKYIQLLLLHFKDPLYHNSLFIMSNTIVSSIFGFIFLIIVTRFYSTDDVGLANAVISGISLIALFSFLGFDALLIRYLPKTERPVDLINFSFSLSTTTSLIIAAIFVLGIHIWSPRLNFIRDNPKFAVCFIIFAIFLTLSGMINTCFIAKRQAKFALIKDTLYSVLKIPLPFILILFFRAFGIVGSWGISIAIAVILSILLFLPRVQSDYRARLNLDFKIMKGLWHYSIGSYLISILGSMPTLILPIIIVNRSGGSDNAYYYTAWTLACLLFIIPQAVAQSLFSEGSHFEDKLDTNVKRAYKFTFILLIPAMIVLLVADKWLLLIFGSGYSENGEALLRYLALSGIFIGVNSIYTTILRVDNKIPELIAMSAFSTLAVLIGSYFIIPMTGIIGISYIWLSVQGIVSIYVVARLIMIHYKQKAN